MKTININELVKQIRDGKTRDEIKEEYNLNPSDFRAFKQHPKIKGLKVGIAPSILFTDEPVEVDYKDHPGAGYTPIHSDSDIDL